MADLLADLPFIVTLTVSVPAVVWLDIVVPFDCAVTVDVYSIVPPLVSVSVVFSPVAYVVVLTCE